jgi:hypothetical protein
LPDTKKLEASTRASREPPCLRERRPGRPSKLTNETAWRVIALLAVGSTLEAAARDVGVTPRAIQLWRQRAYSREPADQPFVEFEQALTRALIARGEIEQRTRMPGTGVGDVPGTSAAQPFAELLADFARDLDSEGAQLAPDGPSHAGDARNPARQRVRQAPDREELVDGAEDRRLPGLPLGQ